MSPAFALCTRLGPLDPGTGAGLGPTVTVADGVATVRDGGRLVWEGPEAALAARPETADEPCGWTTTDDFLLPPWPEPIPLAPGEVLAWVAGGSALVAGPDQRTLYTALRAPDGVAGDLAAQLAPGRVRVAGGALLAVASTGPVPADPRDVAPAPLGLAWGDRLPPLAELATVRGPVADAAGRAMVARVSAARVANGLGPVIWGGLLGRAALAHCRYLDAAWRDGEIAGHEEDPARRAFAGVTPEDRGGWGEVQIQHHPRPPGEAVDGLLSSPYHRTWLVHPELEAVGACATPDGARVMEVRVRGAVRTGVAFPADGARGVPLAFDGRADPDPVPLATHPEKTLPLGYPVSAWLPPESRDPSAELDCDGEAIPGEAIAIGTRLGDVVHFVPLRPLPPEAECHWRVVAGRHSLRATFTTAPAPWTPAPAPPALAWLAADLDADRAAAGLPPLIHAAELDVDAAVAGGWGFEVPGAVLGDPTWEWHASDALEADGWGAWGDDPATVRLARDPLRPRPACRPAGAPLTAAAPGAPPCVPP